MTPGRVGQELGAESSVPRLLNRHVEAIGGHSGSDSCARPASSGWRLKKLTVVTPGQVGR
jgi:hypothetical protein